ncbi:MAG: PEP-CTERM sorting domain-containing protein [Bryobacteraceae bacterium]
MRRTRLAARSVSQYRLAGGFITRRSLGLLKSILVVSSIATASAGPISDVVAGFSDSNNPNGVWSYYYGTGPSSDSLYSSGQSDGTTCAIAVCGWYNGGAEPDSITIIQNTTGSTFNTSTTVYIPNNYVNLDPEEYNVEVVFTVPSAGTYLISGNFYGDDSSENSHPVDILDNGSNVYSNTIASYQQEDSFSFSETLAVGNTITFYVGTGSSGCTYCDLSTGLQGTITLTSASNVPEPTTWLLTAAGLVAIISRRRLRRRRNQRAVSHP